MTSVLDALIRLRGPVPEFPAGEVWLTGAGPGDPGLLTLDAIAGLAQADVIVYDALVDERVLALAQSSARLEFAGKRGGRPSALQADITARLIELAGQGLRVLRLKGGDPFIFGRGGEEVLALAGKAIPFRIIPGVTSGLAAMAAARIPATMRGINQILILATGHGADGEEAPDWAALAKLGQPLVIYMAMKGLEAIADALIAGGLPADTPAAVIASTASVDERTVTASLADIAATAKREGLQAPAIAVIGGIVALRDKLLP
ncbi:uroporphyrinogen-III C-methyltransferase [Lacibacterium aquatile]|uniref:uroporphyrinogen-III C-methyltransferase n=1 Tax=Lacibacterium aquatile TaxID=1168082 RepID=A0ABW5DXD7_9PROT